MNFTKMFLWMASIYHYIMQVSWKFNLMTILIGKNILKDYAKNGVGFAIAFAF